VNVNLNYCSNPADGTNIHLKQLYRSKRISEMRRRPEYHAIGRTSMSRAADGPNPTRRRAWSSPDCRPLAWRTCPQPAHFRDRQRQDSNLSQRTV